MVTAKNLTKKFGDIIAVSDVTFSIEPGEFVFLTGPSGSGKTTLLRLINRDLSASSGELQVNGQIITDIKSRNLPVFRRQIGTVFQDFRLLPDRRVIENIALPLEVRGIKTVDITSSVKIALEMVGLTNRAQLFPGQLSGGELQRVSLARAIVGKPKLILADEPTGNLDPKTAKTIVKLLKEIHNQLKTTVLMATHNAEIVNHYALRVLTLDGGKLTQDEAIGKYA